jgi:hypothetical protein
VGYVISSLTGLVTDERCVLLICSISQWAVSIAAWPLPNYFNTEVTEKTVNRKNELEFFQFFADRQGVSEKRIEKRIPLMARVDVLWMDADMTPRVSPATLEDRSQGGVSIRMRNSIEVASHVTIKSGTLQISGIVTNCRRQKIEFVVGVRLNEGEGFHTK